MLLYCLLSTMRNSHSLWYRYSWSHDVELTNWWQHQTAYVLLSSLVTTAYDKCNRPASRVRRTSRLHTLRSYIIQCHRPIILESAADIASRWSEVEPSQRNTVVATSQLGGRILDDNCKHFRVILRWVYNFTRIIHAQIINNVLSTEQSQASLSRLIYAV